jgi:hypothetical protein
MHALIAFGILTKESLRNFIVHVIYPIGTVKLHNSAETFSVVFTCALDIAFSAKSFVA